MLFSSREFVRHARPLAALLVGVGSACSDQGGITDPTSPATLATPVDVAPTAAPSGLLTTEFPATSTGTLEEGGPYNLRSGPGTNYSKLGTTMGGADVGTVCTATRTSSSGTTTVWHRLSTGEWISGGFVDRDSDASTPPACDSPAGPQITPGTRPNDYPYRTHSADGCIHDAWGFCKRQCTSFVAWRLRDVNGIIGFRYSYGSESWGSAKYWASTAKALGYRVDKTPKVGAVAQWTTSASGSGHVAWVASVSSDRSHITIEEYNYNIRRGYSTRTISTSSVHNFIHLY